MARIDVQTLVLAFEKRIESLEKNPPDKVPTSVIIKLLENSIDALLKDHFIHLIKLDLEEHLKKEFEAMRHSFIETTIENILSDEDFREELENKMKKKMIQSIKDL